MFAKSCKKGCYLIHSSQAVIIHRMHVNDWSCVNIQGRRSTGFLLSEPDLEINNTQLHGASTAFMDEVADYLVLINTEWHTDIKQFVDFLLKFILRAST
jgi:hypothetical protein